MLLLGTVAATLILASGTALAENLTGTEGPDAISGSTGGDTIWGLGDRDFLAGDPSLFGPGGSDVVFGGLGDDEAYGRSGSDVVSGGPGNDEVSGTLGSDVVSGDVGDDIVDGGPPFDAFGDAIYGGPGNDIMDAYKRPAVVDIVVCGPGIDIVYTDGRDIISADCEAVVLGPHPDPWDLALSNDL